jgi:hypothetical protein
VADEQEYTSITLMLIPQESDPIVAASSEPAHMTTVWMGESADLSEEQIAAIVAEAGAYAAALDGPITVPVVERGELGDEGADVAFLEASDSLIAMRDGLLDASPTITEAMNSVEQFPDWTPHVTLGYPETPAREEYAGEAVTFDRMGVWVGTERHNFEMGGVVADKITAAAVVAEPEELEDDEMPPDVPEEGEELITEIPVHGVMTVEGVPTGDGRGFREGSLTMGPLPAPLGYEFESGHGSDNSRVAVVGRIDTFEVVEVDGVREARWTGVIHPGKPYANLAIEGILDGSYTGGSVIVDTVAVDVDEEKLRLKEFLLSGEEDKPIAEMTPEELDTFVEDMVGDGKQPTTWFSEANVRRYDMVPTGAFSQTYTALGHEFPEQLTEEQLTASAAALADCGCLEGTEYEDLSSDPVRNARAAIDHYLFEAGFRQISAEERKKLADEGKAMPDGSYPIANVDDLKNAIQAIGRASDPEAAKRHIKKRAKDLGQEGLIPEDWSLLATGGIVAGGTMPLVGDQGGAEYELLPFVDGGVIGDITYNFAPGTHDGPGWITHPIPTARIRRYWVRGKGAAKIRWGEPGDFNRCRMQLAKYVQNPDWLAGLCANMHKEAIGVWPGQETGRHSLVAAADAVRAPLFSLTAALAPVEIE